MRRIFVFQALQEYILLGIGLKRLILSCLQNSHHFRANEARANKLETTAQVYNQFFLYAIVSDMNQVGLLLLRIFAVCLQINDFVDRRASISMSSSHKSPQLMNGLVRSSYDGIPLRRASREDQTGVCSPTCFVGSYLCCNAVISFCVKFLSSCYIKLLNSVEVNCLTDKQLLPLFSFYNFWEVFQALSGYILDPQGFANDPDQQEELITKIGEELSLHNQRFDFSWEAVFSYL